jgi:hypothetical protein
MISKAITENTVRTAAFAALNITENELYTRITNQAYGAVFTDDNGVRRMVEMRAIVRKIDEDMTADEMLAFEAQEYADKVAEKVAKKAKTDKEKAEKIAKDKAKREAAKAKKAAKEADALPVCDLSQIPVGGKFYYNQQVGVKVREGEDGFDVVKFDGEKESSLRRAADVIPM